MVDASRAFAGRVPILGVCLGHQAIALAFGGQIRRAHAVHGHAGPIEHDGRGVFRGLPRRPALTRYHSLVVDRPSLPACLEVSAVTADERAPEIMALRHRRLGVAGVQFHPESVLSGDAGLAVLGNFLTQPTRAAVRSLARVA